MSHLSYRWSSLRFARTEAAVAAQRYDFFDFRHLALHERQLRDELVRFVEGGAFEQEDRAERILTAPDGADGALNIERAHGLRLGFQIRIERRGRKCFRAAPDDGNHLHAPPFDRGGLPALKGAV